MPAQLDALAQRIRNLWVDERRLFDLRDTGRTTDWGMRHMAKWDGGTTADGRFCKSVWPKIAAQCIEHGLNPELLVRAIFHRVSHFPPMPNQALGSLALEKYRLFTAPTTQLEIKNDLINTFESQKSRISSEVTNKVRYYKCDEQMAWRVSIASANIPLTPLFRYCVAKNQGWEELAGSFYDAARHQYSRHPDIYNEVWGDWIPTDFKAAVQGGRVS